MAGRSEHDADFVGYVAVRWHDLVGGLEDAGVAPDEARLAAGGALLAHRGGWDRLVRDREVDVVLWADARERAGLPPRPGEAVPHAVRPPDPSDPPEPWLERAGQERAAARARTVRRGLVGLVVVAALAAGWAWWAGRPVPPPVREEANPLPVVWYAGGDLHLPDVVVGLPGIEEFVAIDDVVAVRMRSGELLQVDGDGAVAPLDVAPTELDDPPQVRAYEPPGRYDVSVQGVPLADGGWAYVIDSARRHGATDAVRQSETGRRALVVCDGDGTCAEPVTIDAGGTIRLR
ncbi:hypothetical protein KDN32_11285 [Nocardioides sp. J2M5]|uniref:hypothetical protein n=1 Tax=Nocardioides palaemonis TaxID=2829810 RepID=UPI001BA8E85B|nr:hypothetical protein [Nocardioides palaemonis]MBS2938326.1 hypothetical protein [Nocardioides palaemonis]